MGNRFDSIDALLGKAGAQLKSIEAEYRSSLTDQAVADTLKVEIKNFCENVRSCLDYLAREIRERCCAGAAKPDRLYFPITQDAPSFAGTASSSFPSLDTTHPTVWAALRDAQPFSGPGTAWLRHFNRLNNENKHEDLVEQTRVESQRVIAKSQSGGMVSWDPKGVKFGSGVLINGVPVDPRTQMPVPHPSQTVQQIIWVDFKFRDLDVSAIQLLRDALTGVRQIVHDIKNALPT